MEALCREIAPVRPLGTAAFAKRPDLEKLLLEAGADPSLAREEPWKAAPASIGYTFARARRRSSVG
jgi:hypothetical protein